MSRKEQTAWLTAKIDEKCGVIESMLVDMAQRHGLAVEEEKQPTTREKRLTSLIQERRQEKSMGYYNSVALTSKKIQKEVRAVARARAPAKIDKILTEFRGLKLIAEIKNDGMKQGIGKMKMKSGEYTTDFQEIADVFAVFYEDLYAKRDVADDSYRTSMEQSVPRVTAEEIEIALKKMKNGKACDSKRIVVEMLKSAGKEMHKTLAEMFTEIMQEGSRVPQYWKETITKVLFKKGDETLPENYRPIAILSILYKVFSRVLCSRVEDALYRAQSVDQAGFRPGYNCEDHLLTIEILTEKSLEFNMPFWACALDFQKAFDTVQYSSLWHALLEQGIQPQYIELLSRLYEGQSCRVQTEKVSRAFKLQRGTKQGDPISPPLFNSVSQSFMGPLAEKWTKMKMGVQLGNRYLQNLRFADGILLVARSLGEIRTMLADVAQAAGQVGLELHMGKTVILSNGIGKDIGQTSVVIRDQKIKILRPFESTAYLGRALNLIDPNDTEISNRITKAWKKFFSHKHELCSKYYSTEVRFKLFDSVITPSILYGCGAWAMTKKR